MAPTELGKAQLERDVPAPFADSRTGESAKTERLVITCSWRSGHNRSVAPLVPSQRPASRLIIICGLPGAGKTTLARNLEERLSAIRLNPDDWMTALSINLWQQDVRARIEALQWALAQRLLETGNIVIIEWGTWSRSERQALWAGARALGAAVELHSATAPLEELWQRIEQRAAEDPRITRDQLVEWEHLFEPPSEEELSLYDRPLIDSPLIEDIP